MALLSELVAAKNEVVAAKDELVAAERRVSASRRKAHKLELYRRDAEPRLERLVTRFALGALLAHRIEPLLARAKCLLLVQCTFSCLAIRRHMPAQMSCIRHICSV